MKCYAHVCPVKSRGEPRPEGSLPDLRSAGLYDSGTGGSTKTYLQHRTEEKEESRERETDLEEL